MPLTSFSRSERSEPFLREIKTVYTDLINSHLHDPEKQLRVFNPESIYLSTKKIGKNNPKEAGIKADNEARQEWNQAADMAFVTGILEAKTMEAKQGQILGEVKNSIRKNGFMPNLFRTIVGKAKEFLQSLIRQQDMPEKPTLSIDRTEFRTRQGGQAFAGKSPAGA